MRKVLLTSACLATLAFGQVANALQFNLNYEFSGGTSPSGTAPWVVIDINNAGADAVTIRINNSGLTGNEFNSGTYLNISDSIGPLSFGSVTRVGSFTDPSISRAANSFKADGDGYFDLLFAFADSNSGTERFGAGESITYTVSAAGLDESDFNLTSLTGGGNGIWHSASHVQGIGPSSGLSGWIGDTTTPNGVPDAGSTMMLLGLAVTGMGWMGRRLKA